MTSPTTPSSSTPDPSRRRLAVLAACQRVGTDEDDEPCLDADQLQVRVGGRQMQLSRLEFGVAQTLIARQGRAVSRSDLIEQVWGTTYLGGSNVVDAVVRTLRSKLGDDAAMIETIRGVGYRYKRT